MTREPPRSFITLGLLGSRTRTRTGTGGCNHYGPTVGGGWEAQNPRVPLGATPETLLAPFQPCPGTSGVLPLTVRVTSRSPAPTRGTTARHTYFPASSWRTVLRVRVFSLLRT